MPEAERQEAALAALTATTPGDLVVRWNLHRGFLYQAAKQRYEPFDKLVDEDPETRRILARMAAKRLQGRPQGVDHRQQQGRGLGAAVPAQAGRGDRNNCSNGRSGAPPRVAGIWKSAKNLVRWASEASQVALEVRQTRLLFRPRPPR